MPKDCAIANPSDLGSIPITPFKIKDSDVFTIFNIRSVPMFPDPIIAHFVLFIFKKNLFHKYQHL